jgi:hypothetical protein
MGESIVDTKQSYVRHNEPWEPRESQKTTTGQVRRGSEAAAMDGCVIVWQPTSTC